MRVAVIGAGVVGLTSAVAVKESFPTDSVTVFSHAFSPNTTGDGSAGLWGPFALTDTSVQDIITWAGKTHKWLEAFWKSDLAADVGVSLIPVTRIFNDKSKFDITLKLIQVVYGGTPLDAKDLKQLSDDLKKNFRFGFHCITYTCEPTKLLPWLEKRFISLGGQVKRQLISSFDDLRDGHFDFIINCSGLGASQLANDDDVVPIRGQVTRVKAPWIYEVILEDVIGGNYVIPNMESIILGGTCQRGDFDTSVRTEDSQFIHAGCSRMMPSLRDAQILTQWTGLRPGRSRVRLEKEDRNLLPGENVTIIHNYGHGGSGVTLSWGCALDVVQILRQSRTKNTSHL